MAGGTGSGWEVPGAPASPGGQAPAAASTGTGSGWEVPGGVPASKPASHGGGGLFASIKSLAHTVASKADLAAHDVAAIPGGIYTMAKVGGNDLLAIAEGAPLSDPRRQAANNLGLGILHGMVQSVEHPLRDPFQTLTTVLPAAGSVARAGLAVSDASAAARAGDLAGAAKALVTKPTTTRIINVPKLVAPAGEGPAQLVHEPAVLHSMEASLPQAVARIHDTLLQKAIDRNPIGQQNAVTRYADRRVAKANDELARRADRTRLIPAQLLERAGRQVDEGVSRKEAQLALFLRSANVTGDEAARYWRGQAAKGVNPVDTGKLSVLAQSVHDKGLVGLGADGNVAVDGEKFPKLARADQLVKENQATREQIIRDHELLGDNTPAKLQQRLDLIGRRMSGGRWEAPTPAKQGRSPKLIAATAELDRITGLHQRALAQEQAWMAKQPSLIAETANRVGGESLSLDNPYRERINNLGHALEVAQARVDRLSKSVQPTGVIGGEEARPGQGYTPLKTSVKRQPQTPFARGRTPVIGGVRNFVTGKRATGEGVASGLIPDNTTAGVARATREALRYAGTVTRRGIVSRYGSDVRRTADDVLVADPNTSQAAIPTHIDELLGRSQSTLDTIPETEHVGLANAMRARLEDAIPGLRDKFATDRAAKLGTRAPEGYKWVPKQMLGELTHEVTPRGKWTRRVDALNSAITAATVYFKISHIPQRFTTNATTSLMQGSLDPASVLGAVLKEGPIADAMRMRNALTEREYAEALAASGAHGYAALPHEGTSTAAKVATKGAQAYARRVDAPFRFLNLVYEAKKAGIDTPAKFRGLLEYARNPDRVNPEYQHVLSRADRASMIYDGLGQNEKRVLARGLWFYPWTKAAVRFGGHTLMEHPLKSLALGAAAQVGRQQQQNLLGDIPSYEYGLVPFSGGPNPQTGDLAVLTPFGTAANVLELLARPSDAGGNLNPALASAVTALLGINQYGNKTKSPIGDALSELFAPTPEAQILNAYLHPAKPTQIFQKTPLSQFERSLAGPALPRKTNKAALNSAAAREKSGR